MSELKKDHWFKFYYHRIIVSCAGWKDDEFGAFIKLLIHQFDKGFVPNDEKELKRIITSYNKNWPLLKTKFKEDNGKLMNHVMKIVRDDYMSKQEKNKENGGKGGRPKKTETKPNGFQNETNTLSVSNSNSDSLKKEGGMGEEKNKTLIIPSMLTTWKTNNPDAYIRFEDDSEQLMEIAKKMKDWLNLKGDVVTEGNAEKIKDKWGEMSLFLATDPFLKKYSLVQVNSHLPSVIQAFNNRHNGTHKQAFSSSKPGTADDQNAALSKW